MQTNKRFDGGFTRFEIYGALNGRKNGLSVEQICQMMGLKEDEVKFIFRKYRLASNMKKGEKAAYLNASVREMIELRNRFVSNTNIAKLYNTTPNQIRMRIGYESKARTCLSIREGWAKKLGREVSYETYRGYPTEPIINGYVKKAN